MNGEQAIRTAPSGKPIRRSRIADKVFVGCNYCFMVLLCISIVYPFWQTFVLSFSGAKDASTLGIHVWPHDWSLEAYRFLFQYDSIGRAYWNTIFRTVTGTALSVSLTLIAAYPLSKKELPFRGVVTTYFLIPMFFSGGLIPTYLLIKQLGLLDSMLALILPPAVGIFSVIIMRNFFMTIDKAFEESAFMDGAGYWTLLFRIILPISVPVVATISLWSAVAHWNAWFDAMIYIRDRDKTVIQLILREMLTASSTQVQDLSVFNGQQQAQITLNNVRAAIILVSIGPIVFMYPYIQKYFIKGITLGSLKG